MIALFVFLGLSTFFMLAVRTARALVAQSEIYAEFKQSKIMLAAIWLLPIGYFSASYLDAYFGAMAANILAVLCFTALLILAKKTSTGFESSGTSRTAHAMKTLSTVFMYGLCGLIYVGVRLVFFILEYGLNDNYIA